MPKPRLYSSKLVYLALIVVGAGALLSVYSPNPLYVSAGVVLLAASTVYMARYVGYTMNYREALAVAMVESLSASLGAVAGYVLSGSYYSLLTATSLVIASFAAGIAALRLYTR
ncbi:hypothetical protein ACSU1N_03815 [Thermogladius sp. 4427co]|uniref:hypothetical protein n=1 Tax=Thermogladius sp. 4427co TaxID=3450718 RepID=UPI003F7A5B14